MGDDAGAVRSAVLRLHRATGLPMVFGGALNGRDRLRITELVGNTTRSLDGLVVRHGNGLGGKAMAMGRPMWVSDYPRATVISHDYDGPVGREGLLSIVAAPIVVRGNVRGVLYGALREPLSLADRVVSAAVQAARDLEQDLAVRDQADLALARARHGTVRPGAVHPGAVHPGAVHPDTTGPEGSVPHDVPGAEPAGGAAGSATARWEEVRAVHAELRGLAEQVRDPETRERLREASLRLAAAGRLTPAPPDGPAGAAPPRRPVLSPRELDVLSHVAVGCTNAEAAQRLGVLPETVKSYLRSAMRKLDSHTRLDAVATARRAGLLP